MYCLHLNALAINQDLGQSLHTGATITLEYAAENETTITMEASAHDSSTLGNVGRIVFSFNKFTKDGYIDRLHVSKDKRGSSYGSMLLRFALTKLTSLRCKAVYWQACPYDLHAHQTPENMLPKLIKFYQRHGAQLLFQSDYSARMVYYPAVYTHMA